MASFNKKTLRTYGEKVKMQSRNLCKYPNDLKAYLELCISNENGIVHLEFKGLLVEISIK